MTTTTLPATLRAPFSLRAAQRDRCAAGEPAARPRARSRRRLRRPLLRVPRVRGLRARRGAGPDARPRHHARPRRARDQGRRDRLRVHARISRGRRWRTRRRPRARSRRAAAHKPVDVASLLERPDAELLRGADAVARRAGAPTSSRCCAPRTRRRARSIRASSRSQASFAESDQGGAAVHVATAAWRPTSSRCMRFGVRAVAEDDGKRQSGSGGGGGRYGMEYFAQAERDAAAHGTRGRARRDRDARRASTRRPARCRSCSAPATPASCCTRRSATASRPTSTARRRRTTRARSASRSRRRCAPSSTTARSSSSRGAINVDDEGYAGQNNVLIENGVLVGYMHDRLSAKHYGIKPTGNGRRESFRSMPLPRMTNTSLLGGKDNPEDIIKSVKRGIYAKRFSRRSGQHLQRRLRVLADGELPDRGRQADRAAQGREPDRQRPRGAAPRRHARLATSSSRDGIWTCGKDGQSVPVNVGTPTVRIASITVGGTQA